MITLTDNRLTGTESIERFVSVCNAKKEIKIIDYAVSFGSRNCPVEVVEE